MVTGALLLLSPYFGLRFAWDHAGAFLNVAIASDPAALTNTNNIVLATLSAGLIGLVLFAISLFAYFRAPHHPRLQIQAGAR